MTPFRFFVISLCISLLLLTGCSSSPDRDLLHWEQMGGPPGRDVSTMHVDRQTPETVYAGLRDGSVYRSTDEGSSWILLSTVAPEASLYRFVQDPDDPHLFYACTEQGLFLSRDAGETWSQLRTASGVRQSACQALAIDPYNTRTLYAGVHNGGVARSTDGGATWQAANGGNQPIAAGTPVAILVDPSQPDNILAALTGVGIIRSGNGGNSWQRLTPEFSPTGSSPTSLVVHRTNASTIVYATDAGSIYRSTDGGQNWRAARTGLEGDRITQLVPSSSFPDRLYAGSANGILLSTDFGATWAPLTFHMPAVPASIALSNGGSSPVLYLFGEGTGVRRSRDNGATWMPAGLGLGASTATLLAADASGNRLFAVVGGTVAGYIPSAGGWSTAGPGLRGADVTSLVVDNSTDATLFATTPLGVFVSSDDGASWQDIGRSLRMSPSFVDVHPTIPTRIFASGERGLFMSTDKGATWRECMPRENRYRVTSLTFLPTDAGNVHGATATSGTLASSDGGLQWRASKQGLPPVAFTAVTLDRDNPSICYAWSATGDGYRSMNGGLGWNHYNTPWTPGDSVKVAFDKLQPWSVVVLAGNGRLFYSGNGGGTWVAANIAPIPAPVISLAWNETRRILFGGTRHKGVFQLPLSEWLRTRLGE